MTDITLCISSCIEVKNLNPDETTLALDSFQTQNSQCALIPMSPLPSATALDPSSGSLIGQTSRVKGQGSWQILRLDNNLSTTWNKSLTRLSMTATITDGKATYRGLWVNLRWDPCTCALALPIHAALFISTVQRTTTQPASPPAHLPQPHV